MPVSEIPVLLVEDLDVARRFYLHALGCRVVRTDISSLEVELHGHSLLLRTMAGDRVAEVAFLLGVDDWCTASERLREHAVAAVVEPGKPFSATPGEQCAMHLTDPDGNTIVLLGFAREADQLAA